MKGRVMSEMTPPPGPLPASDEGESTLDERVDALTRLICYVMPSAAEYAESMFRVRFLMSEDEGTIDE